MRFLRQRPRPSYVLLAAGGLALVVGGAVSLQAWYAGLQWQASPEAAQAQRNVAAPEPIWITPGPRATRASVPVAPTATSVPAAAALAVSVATAVPTTEAPVETPAPTLAPPTVEPTATLGPSDLQLASSAFQFDDPPEPGAHARLDVTVHNPTDQPGGALTLLLPEDWLKGYRIEATDPKTAATPTVQDHMQRLTFDGPAALEDLEVEVSVVTTDEVIDAPALRVVDSQGREVGHAQPRTEAPPAQPGPVYSIEIPKLNLKTGVVQVDWEPPLFVVGQLKSSAHVTEGNSVLVGHVRGAPGYNVFDHLDQVNIGDQIVASSRGMPYTFVVSMKEVLPEGDTSPTDASDAPRLTLMTCAGDWNPITRDYSDRLWVIAEPPAAAAVTIRTHPSGSATPVPVGLSRFAQVSPAGGLGNTDVDLSESLGAPTGESSQHLAVYTNGIRADLQASDGRTPRAVLVGKVQLKSAPLRFDEAVTRTRQWLPRDATPRAGKPEGNQQFVVERFSSAVLASAFPTEWFTDRGGQPGDFVVVYVRRNDGLITAYALAIGDDVQQVLKALDAP